MNIDELRQAAAELGFVLIHEDELGELRKQAAEAAGARLALRTQVAFFARQRAEAERRKRSNGDEPGVAEFPQRSDGVV